VDELPLLPDFPLPDMFGHGRPDAFIAWAPDRAADLLLSPAPATWDDLAAPAAFCARADECVTAAECVTAGDALVDALAIVRPRPRLAPRTPAAIAVPASGREILIWFPLIVLVASGAGRRRSGPPGGPPDSVTQPEFCCRLR
jgi:hypothetical protein